MKEARDEMWLEALRILNRRSGDDAKDLEEIRGCLREGGPRLRERCRVVRMLASSILSDGVPNAERATKSVLMDVAYGKAQLKTAQIAKELRADLNESNSLENMTQQQMSDLQNHLFYYFLDGKGGNLADTSGNVSRITCTEQ